MIDRVSNEIRNLLIGVDCKIYIEGGHKVTPINFDNAATTPVLKEVFEKIKKESEFYGSIGRGLGQKSEYTTKMYYGCRDYILNFFNADKDKYTAIFVNNTTDGINKLSSILIQDKSEKVITTRMEHHSNDLPWRHKCNVLYIEVDSNGRLNFNEIETLLKDNNNEIRYISVTAASNVTGYTNNIHKIASIAHKYNAKIIVDGAQIVAHKRVSIKGDTEEEDIDYFIFSGHKMYAPFGGGVIIGLKEELDKYPPALYGGGIVDVVTDSKETFLEAPEKDEAGTPNYFGAISIVEAIKILDRIGFDYIEEHEKRLLKRTIDGLSKIDNVILYGDTTNISDKIGIIVFNIDGINNYEVALALAKLRGIAVRQGGFCAHPYIARLMNVRDDTLNKQMKCADFKMPGMIRLSFGIYNTEEEVDVFLGMVKFIASQVTN